MDLRSQGYWSVALRRIYVKRIGPNDGKETELTNPHAKRIALDTGSSLTMGAPEDMSRLLSLVGPCRAREGGLEKLPTIVFELEPTADEHEPFALELTPEL